MSYGVTDARILACQLFVIYFIALDGCRIRQVPNVKIEIAVFRNTHFVSERVIKDHHTYILLLQEIVRDYSSSQFSCKMVREAADAFSMSFII